MSKERFLLYMLASIFAFQGGTFAFGIYWCANNGGIETCPKITETYEKTFNVAIATTLALLTGTAIREK